MWMFAYSNVSVLHSDHNRIPITFIVVYTGTCLLEYGLLELCNVLDNNCFCRLFRRWMQRRCGRRMQWISTWWADEQAVCFRRFQRVLRVTKFLFSIAEAVHWTILSAFIKIHDSNGHWVMNDDVDGDECQCRCQCRTSLKRHLNLLKLYLVDSISGHGIYVFTVPGMWNARNEF